MLWTGAFLVWVAHLTKWTVDPSLWTDCKLGYFLFFTSSQNSSVLLVIMTIEKLLVLYFPLKVQRLCTVHTARWVCLVTTLVFAVYNFHLFFVVEASTDYSGINQCIWVNVPKNYQSSYNYVDSIIYSFAPFAIMIMANSAIIYKFMKAKWESRHGDTASTSQALSKAAERGTVMLITISRSGNDKQS